MLDVGVVTLCTMLHSQVRPPGPGTGFVHPGIFPSQFSVQPLIWLQRKPSKLTASLDSLPPIKQMAPSLCAERSTLLLLFLLSRHHQQAFPEGSGAELGERDTLMCGCLQGCRPGPGTDS